jgi:PPK2 family polyphosphate:nucleotide phosphotransferase
MLDVQRYKVKPGRSVSLARRNTADSGPWQREADCEREVCETRDRLYDRHVLLNADARYAVLVLLQGMDSAGKDPVTRHLSLGMHLLASKAEKFNAPSKEEQKHDLFWRFHPRLPEAGWITIFNRSWYEGVLADRVEERVPEEVWRARYDQFNAFEKILTQNNTLVLKCFLHVSKEEQKRRLEDRLRDPTKSWAFSQSDLDARARWDDYQAAYEECLSRTSTEHAPWYIVPADVKWYRDHVVMRLLTDLLDRLDLRFPEPELDPATVTIE